MLDENGDLEKIFSLLPLLALCTAFVLLVAAPVSQLAALWVGESYRQVAQAPSRGTLRVLPLTSSHFTCLKDKDAVAGT